VAFGIRVSCDEDSLIWNYHVLLLCNFRLTPLEIKNIIRKEFPILAKIVSVEDFFVDFAFFIFKQPVQVAAKPQVLSVGWKINSSTYLPELRAFMLPPQSSETQFIPSVPTC
jgi:hypothetical protein